MDKEKTTPTELWRRVLWIVIVAIIASMIGFAVIRFLASLGYIPSSGSEDDSRGFVRMFFVYFVPAMVGAFVAKRIVPRDK